MRGLGRSARERRPSEAIRVLALAHASATAGEGLLRPRRNWWREWSWLFVTGFGIAVFWLAFAGASGRIDERLLDALRLFPSGFPGSQRDNPDPPSITFQVAQNLAPFVGLFLTLRVLASLYARQYTALKAKLRRQHVVVCGLGEKGVRSTRAFLRSGYRVTCIDLDAKSDAATDARARGALVLEGDATEAVTLAGARVDRAKHVICACHEDNANASIAAQVAQLVAGRKGEPANVFVHITDAELAHVLRARALGRGGLRLQFFNIYAVWARALLRAGPLGAADGDLSEPPHLVVVGATDLGVALVVRAARRWHFSAASARGRRLRITLVDPDATAVCGRIEARHPSLPKRSELVPISRSLDARTAGEVAEELERAAFPESAVYLCLFDDADNLSLALQIRHHVGEQGPLVYVPMSAWTRELAPLLLGNASGVRAIGFSSDPDSLDLLRDSTHEAIARAVHASYLEDRREGPEFGSLPGDTTWDDLRADLKESNRRHVDGMFEQLRSLWFEIVPLFDWDAPPVVFTNGQVEALAELEHARWCREKVADGYVYGPERDDSSRPKRHHLLVSWDQLPEKNRDTDRMLVRGRPELLAPAGYQLVHLAVREELARLIHQRHVQERRQAGENEASNPLLVPWEHLTDEQRESSLASTDDTAVKLVRVGCRAEPGLRGDTPAFSFTQATLERLAKLEHERWCRQRTEQGWRHSAARNDDAKLHPDLVPWAELSEERRQIDRDHVAAVPELLAEVGVAVVAIDDGLGRTG